MLVSVNVYHITCDSIFFGTITATTTTTKAPVSARLGKLMRKNSVRTQRKSSTLINIIQFTKDETV